jgi:hypothetical protein
MNETIALTFVLYKRMSVEVWFTHKSQEAVRAKHLDDSLEAKTRIFLSKC